MMATRAELRRDFLVGGSLAPISIAEGAVAGAPREAVIAIGVFDGVHAGHRELIAATVAQARGCDAQAVCVTFDPDPDMVLSARPAPHLMATSDRLRALAQLGVDEVLVVPFTRELAALNHTAFFERVVFPRLRVRAIHVGCDFRLGAHGEGSVERLRAWGAPYGIEVVGHELVELDGAAITASRIRRLLARGALDEANRCLGRHHFVRGRVAAGRGAGTDMGFPTANVEVADGVELPKDGVYAGYALADGLVWPAAINAGVPPMFQDDPRAASLEATLLGFSGDLYGCEVALAFARRLRATVRFATIEELVSQVMRDIDAIRSSMGESGVSLVDDQR